MDIKKAIRFVLNVLFAIVVIAGIAIGWNMEIDDPDAWFPNEVKKEAPAPTTQEAPAAPTAKQ